MTQIHDRRYKIQLKQSPFVKQIVKIRIMFCDKAVVATYQHNDDPILWSEVLEPEEE